MSRFDGWTQQSAYEKTKANPPKKETANGLTKRILTAINMQPGCVAYRINNVGVWDAAKGVYRRGGTQRGIFDIAAVVRGRAVWIEVKAGRDKPSQDQLIFKQEIERAGGLAFFAYSTDEFLSFFTEILNPCHTQPQQHSKV